MRQRIYRTGWVFLILLVAACSGKKEPNVAQSAPPLPSIAGEAQSSSDIPNLSGAVTLIPDQVKGKWGAVKLLVEDKKEKSRKEYVVNLGSVWTVPESNLKVKVGEFLPDLIIQDTVFTSASEELKNPAVHVVITEGDKELFKGWLFSLYPTMHPFQHERFSITLKDAVAA
jgi:hypothetical protein